MGRNGLSVRGTLAWSLQFYSEFLPDTDVDIATRLISLEDDPTLPAFTFRMWFLGLGLSCFGAVLGQIFVGSPPFDVTESKPKLFQLRV
jgi:hypothetical protein